MHELLRALRRCISSSAIRMDGGTSPCLSELLVSISVTFVLSGVKPQLARIISERLSDFSGSGPEQRDDVRIPIGSHSGF